MTEPRASRGRGKGLVGGKFAFAAQASASGLSFLVQLVVARLLGANSFGAYSLVQNWAQLVAVPADLGASVAVSRVIPEHQAKGEPRLALGAVRAAIWGSWIGGIVLGSALLVFGSIFSLGLGGGWVLFLCCACVPLFTVSLTQMSLLRASSGVVSALTPYLLLQPVLVLAFVSMFRSGLTTEIAVGCTAAASIAVVVVNALILRSVRQRLSSAGSPMFALRKWLAKSLPLLAYNSFQLIFQRLDIILVGILLSPTAAGVYALTNRIASLASLMGNAYGSMSAPQMALAHWSGDGELVMRIFRQVRLVTSIPAIGVLLVAICFGRSILSLFGLGFESGYWALCIYALGQTLAVVCGPVGHLALVSGHARAMIVVNSSAGLISLVGYAILIPHYGIDGAAWASSLGTIARNVGAVLVVQLHGYSAFWRSTHREDGVKS